MSVQITTGEYTQVGVLNKVGWAEIKTATDYQADAAAQTNEVRAFNDLGEPLVISTDMGQTTGKLSIIKTSTLPFEALAMGKTMLHTAGDTNLGNALDVTKPFAQNMPTVDPFSKFTLKEAIQNPLWLFANFKDKITGLIFSSQWINMAFLNSDGTQEAVNGTLANSFSFTATGKYAFPYAIAVGDYAQYTADTHKKTWMDIDKQEQNFLPGGTTSDGTPSMFQFADGDYNPTPAAGTLVAWLTTVGM